MRNLSISRCAHEWIAREAQTAQYACGAAADLSFDGQAFIAGAANAIENLFPAIRRTRYLQHRHGQRPSRLFGHPFYNRKFRIDVIKIADDLQNAHSRVSEPQGDARQLLRSSRIAGCERAVSCAVIQAARARKSERSGCDGLASKLAHSRNVLR